MYNWTREITAPFLSHRVRLWVHTMANMQETFTSLVVVPALNISSLIRHMYWSTMVPATAFRLLFRPGGEIESKSGDFIQQTLAHEVTLLDDDVGS